MSLMSMMLFYSAYVPILFYDAFVLMMLFYSAYFLMPINVRLSILPVQVVDQD